MSILRFGKQLPSNNRPEILEATHCILDKFLAGETYASIWMPPRYGKSSVIRIAAMELNAITGMPAVMTAPWTDNVDQILKTEKIGQMYRDYGIMPEVRFATHRVRHLATHRWWRQEDGLPTLVSCTAGLINNIANQEQFLDGISDMHEQSNRMRSVVFVDECHLFKEAKAWGRLIAKIVERGGFITLLTGTAVPGIPGFSEQYSGWTEVTQKSLRKEMTGSETKWHLETREGERRSLESLSADYEVKWRHAFDIGALALTNVAWIDMDVVDESTGEPLGKLSELEAADLSGRLKSVMESSEFMVKQTAVALHRLLQMRSRPKTKTAQMLVVTGADTWVDGDDKEANRHANAIAKELKRQIAESGEYLKIAIATGAVERADKVVDGFREGHSDILIVKTMGIVGLDVPPCKVLMLASSLREGPLAIQALSRVLTEWDGAVADMVLPQDCKMVDTFNRMIVDQGGKYSESNLHLVDSIEVEPPAEKPAWNFNHATVQGYSDHSGKQTAGDFEDILQVVKRKFFTGNLTDVQIIENHKRGAYSGLEEETAALHAEKQELQATGIKNLDEGREDYNFGKRANQIVSRHVSYKANPLLWSDMLTRLQGLAKEICGVRQAVPTIDDVGVLKRLYDALDQAEVRLFGHVTNKKAL